jgi:hypothetical protein
MANEVEVVNINSMEMAEVSISKARFFEFSEICIVSAI